jgi:beta-phosphoglucomutase-like phosphatase (HAD superfamily)
MYNNRMKYKALIFDMDGTLVHNMPFHNKALEETLTEAGVQLPNDMTVLYNSIYGKKTLEVFRILLNPHLTDSEVAYWSERKETLYRKQYASQREALPGLQQVLEQAKSLGLPMARASASSPDNISFIVDELDLRRHFKVVVSGHNI